MLPQIVSGEPATHNTIKNKIENIVLWFTGAAVIIYDADGWGGELCNISGGEAECCCCLLHLANRQSMGCSCASLLGPPKVESECAGAAETKR